MDLIFGIPPKDLETSEHTEYAYVLEEQVEKMLHFERDHLRVKSQRQKRLYDQRSNSHSHARREKV